MINKIQEKTVNKLLLKIIINGGFKTLHLQFFFSCWGRGWCVRLPVAIPVHWHGLPKTHSPEEKIYCYISSLFQYKFKIKIGLQYAMAKQKFTHLL